MVKPKPKPKPAPEPDTPTPPPVVKPTPATGRAIPGGVMLGTEGKTPPAIKKVINARARRDTRLATREEEPLPAKQFIEEARANHTNEDDLFHVLQGEMMSLHSGALRAQNRLGDQPRANQLMRQSKVLKAEVEAIMERRGDKNQHIALYDYDYGYVFKGTPDAPPKDGGALFSLSGAPARAGDTSGQVGAARALFAKLGLNQSGFALRLRHAVEGEKFSGRIDYDKALVELIYSPDGPAGVRGLLRHEATHIFEMSFTPQEWALFQQSAVRGGWLAKHNINKRYATAYTDLEPRARAQRLLAEAIAEQYRDFGIGADSARGLSGAVRQAFQRVKDFFEAARNKADGLGFKSANDLFRSFESGKFARERSPSYDFPTGKAPRGERFYIGDSPDPLRGERAVNRSAVYLDSMMRGMLRERIGPVEYKVSARDNRLDGQAAAVRGRAIYIRNDIEASEISAARMWGLGQWLKETQDLPGGFDTMQFDDAWSGYLVNAAELDSFDRSAYLAIQAAVSKEPRFAKYISDLQKTMDEIVEMAPAEATRMQWEGKRVDPKLSFSFDLPRRIVRNIQSKVLDSNRPLKDIDELNQAQGLNGYSYAAFDAVRNSGRMYSRFIHKGAWEFQTKPSGEWVAKPIKGARGLEEVLKPISDASDLEGFFDVWLARSSLETREQGREFTIPESDARATIAAAEASGKLPLYDKVLADFYENVDKPWKRMLVSSGVLSQDQIDGWQRQFWLPFFQQYASQPRAWSRPLKGGGIHRLQDPAEALALRYHAEIQLMAENMAKRTLIKQVGDSEHILTHLGDIDVVRRGGGPSKEALISELAAIYPDDARGRGFAAVLEDMPNANLALEASMANRNSPNWMIVLEKGKGQVYEVKDKGVLEALQAFRPAQRGRIVKALNKARSVYQAGTTYTPNFAWAGYLKDVIQSALIAEKGRRPAYGRGLKSSIQLDDAFYDSLMYGSPGTGIFLTEQGTFRPTWKKSPPASVERLKKHPLEAATAILRGYNRVHQTLEQSNRLGTLTKELEAGTSPLQSAAQARFIHGNYATRGTSPVANAVLDTLPYARAGLIGFDATMQRFIGSQPLSGRLRVESRIKDVSRVGLMTAASAIPIILLQLSQRDNPIEAQRSKSDRALYHQAYFPKKAIPEGLTAEEAINGDYYGIVAVRNWYETGGIAGGIANVFTSIGTENPRYGEILTAAIKEFVPISRPGGAPGALRELLENKNFFGGPVVPQSELDERGNAIMPWQQTGKRELFTGIQRATGIFPGHVRTTEKMIEGLTGAMGRYALDSADAIYRLSSGIGTTELPRSNKLFLREPKRVRFNHQVEMSEMREDFAMIQSVAATIALSKSALAGQSNKSIQYLENNASDLAFGKLIKPLRQLGTYERYIKEQQRGPKEFRIPQDDFTREIEVLGELRGKLERSIVSAQRDLEAAFKGDKQAESRYRSLLGLLGLDKREP